jgi:hypothetical protein
VTEIVTPLGLPGIRAQTVGDGAEVVLVAPCASVAASVKQLPALALVTVVVVPVSPVATWTKGPFAGPWKRVYVSAPLIALPSVFLVGAVQPRTMFWVTVWAKASVLRAASAKITNRARNTTD